MTNFNKREQVILEGCYLSTDLAGFDMRPKVWASVNRLPNWQGQDGRPCSAYRLDVPYSMSHRAVKYLHMGDLRLHVVSATPIYAPRNLETPDKLILMCRET